MAINKEKKSFGGIISIGGHTGPVLYYVFLTAWFLRARSVNMAELAGDDIPVQSSEYFPKKALPARPALPVDLLLPEIIEFLKSSMLLLVEASPGAGKTTRIPPALLTAGYDRVLVLEPRRLAARMAARRVSAELDQPVGATVGYQVRFEDVSTSITRVLYLTEGVLTRKLLSGSTLPGVDIVILDEFHERHLETDLALALLLRLQKTRPELKIVLMSATLAADAILKQLGSPPLIQVPGRLFPVAITYTPQSAAPLEEQVAAAVSVALNRTTQHVLVFLPGAAEIRKAMQSCSALASAAGVLLHALHGDMTPDEQDGAVAPSARRKVIFSTNVAESSVTIEGVEAVIDSGLARVLTHSLWSGLSRLQLEKASQASVTQRSGRAGRTGPGIAIRLFPESDFLRRPMNLQPEVLRSDFAPTLLQLSASDIPLRELSWLDAPAPDNVKQAQALLELLGALQADGKITALGRQMARYALSPRLARFMVAACEFGIAREAADLAARLSEARFRVDDDTHASFASDLDAIVAAEPSYATRQLRQQILNLSRNVAPSIDTHALEKALLLAYPDRVAQKRADTLLIAGGGTARLDRRSHAAGDFIVALELDDRSDQASVLVRLAVAIKPDWLLDAFPNQIQASEELVWNRDAERIELRQLLRYRQLALDETSSSPRNSPGARDMLVAKAMEAGLGRFTDAEALSQFELRLRFAAEHGKFEVPADLWTVALQNLCAGMVSFAELRAAARDNGLMPWLEAQLPLRLIDQVAPTHVALPSGRRARIAYHDGRPPSVASRLQDFFGMLTTPTVARGTVPLVVHLLAPNQRPVQVTTDLVSFWENLYPQLRRELSRRYPRHSWPETPA